MSNRGLPYIQHSRTRVSLSQPEESSLLSLTVTYLLLYRLNPLLPSGHGLLKRVKMVRRQPLRRLRGFLSCGIAIAVGFACLSDFLRWTSVKFPSCRLSISGMAR